MFVSKTENVSLAFQSPNKRKIVEYERNRESVPSNGLFGAVFTLKYIIPRKKYASHIKTPI